MVSIHRPLGYGPSTLPLRHSADVNINHLWCGFVSFVLYCVCSKTSGSDGDSKLGDKKKKEGGGDVDFDPSKANFHPVDDACWKRGQKSVSLLFLSLFSLPPCPSFSLSHLTPFSLYRVPYLAVARTFEKIEEESKRLKIISTLTNLFRSVILLSPNELLSCVYLCLNKVSVDLEVYYLPQNWKFGRE